MLAGDPFSPWLRDLPCRVTLFVEAGDPSETFVMEGGAGASEVLCEDADLRNTGILMAQDCRPR